MDRNISEGGQDGQRPADQWKPRADLLELAHDAIIAWADKTGSILYWSAGASELYGWNAEQALGQPIHEFLKETFPQPLSAIEIELYRNGRWEGELVHTRSDGSPITVASRWALQRESQGELSAVVETNRDITRQKQVEGDLRNVSDRMNLAIRATRAGTWTWSIPENAVRSDERLPALFGLPSGTKVSAIDQLTSRIQSDDLAGVQYKLAQSLRPDSFAAKFRVVWSNGDHRTLASHAETAFEGDEAVRMTGYTWDITGRAAVDDRLDLALGDSSVGAWTWDIRNDVVSTDDYVPVLFGLPPEATIASLDFFMSMVLPEDRDRLRAKIAAAVAISNYETEFRVLWPGGSVHAIAARAETRLERGRPVEITGVCQDVTDRKVIETAFRATDARLKQIQKIAHVGDWEFTPATGEIRWSDEIYRIFGLDPEGTSITYERSLSMISAEDRAVFVDDMERTMRMGEPFSSMLRITREDGSVRYIEHRGGIRSGTDADGEIKLEGTILDVTEIKKAELALSELDRQVGECTEELSALDRILDEKINVLQYLVKTLLASFEGAPNAMIMVGPDGLIALVNRQAEKLFGYERRDLVGQSVDILLPERFRSSHGGLWRGFFAAPSTRAMGGTRDLFALRKDSSEAPVEIGLSAVDTADGQFVIASIIDITERRNISKQLEKSYRELQDFASVASHDLQEPLRQALAFGNSLKSLCAGALEGQGEDYLNRMLNAVSRMQSLVKDLLAFSQVGNGAELIDVDLTAVTQEVLSDMESRITETGAIVEVGYLPIIKADPLQIRQLLRNLIGNALKFHKKDQTPSVRVRSEDVDAAGAAGGLLRILVEDDGIGFDEKYLDRIFIMFQRLHGRSEYEGTGVGLAICKKIAERHGGKITAASTPGHGAVFAVELPKTHPPGHGGAAH